MKDTDIFRSNGNYLGFTSGGFIYSRDGIYLGWLENEFAWDSSGTFRGFIYEKNGHSYIVINRFSIPPVPRSPRLGPPQPVLPPPPPNIPPISLPVGYVDSF